MVDYVEKLTKLLKEHKIVAGIIVAVSAIILMANFLGALKSIYEFLSPSTSLGIKTYDWNFVPTYNENKTAFIGLNATFPTQITNTGRIPVHIVACDVFVKPIGEVGEEHISEIVYLKPQDSLSYNITKYFDVLIPLDAVYFGHFTNYTLLVMYTDDSNYMNAKSVWTDFPAPIPTG